METSVTLTAGLPSTMKALVLEAVGQPLTLKDVPVPQATPGSVVVKVLASTTAKNYSDILSGKSFFTFPIPFIPGARSVGRIVAGGSDATILKVGQLVMLEPFVRGRDDGDVQILWGAYDGPSAESKKLMADSWRDGTWAEYVRAPLENCWALDEKLLCGSPASGGYGYTTSELTMLAVYAVVYGGLRGIDLKAGETIVVAPATGLYTGAAVATASAMGAKVIAASRNLAMLKKIQAIVPRVDIVQLKCDVKEDAAAISKFGPVDAFIDIGPMGAKDSTHVRTCFTALKQYGRASLMSHHMEDIPVPYALAVAKNLTIRGQYMYERADVKGLIKLVESGVLKLGKSAGVEITDEFRLEEFSQAFEAAEEKTGFNKMVVLTP